MPIGTYSWGKTKGNGAKKKTTSGSDKKRSVTRAKSSPAKKTRKPSGY